MSLQHAQETQSSLPQGWAWPAQDSTREGWQNPWAGLWESAGFPFSSCCPLDCKTADTETASPWITCPCLCCLSPITAHPRVQPATHEVHHWPSPLFRLWMTTPSLWERFPDVLTLAKFNQGSSTPVELWGAGSTFYSRSHLPSSSLNSSEQRLAPNHNLLFFSLLLASNSTCSLKWVRNGSLIQDALRL